MALSNTPLLDAIRVARQDEYYQASAVRKKMNGLTESLYEDRDLLNVDRAPLLAAKRSAAQVVKADVLTDLPSGVGNAYACGSDDEPGDARITVTTAVVQKGFKIKESEAKNFTNGYQGVLENNVRSVFKRLHEGIESNLEASIAAAADYPVTTYPYAHAATTDPLAIPLADWDVSGTNPKPKFLGKVAALFKQNDYKGLYRLIGNANFSYALSQLFSDGSQNGVNNQWQFGEFLAAYSTVNGSHLDPAGVKAFAFNRGEHGWTTWNDGIVKGGDGASKRWYTVVDPVYAGLTWDVYYNLNCDTGKPVEEWSFACYMAHVYAPSQLAIDGTSAIPATFKLDLATS